ncbi:exodeoxyribonuclease VII large subunit [Oleiagrimonas sp. C23AA]|uniref:exodeoxyribonuclease VII large subunit n=1 Tax=Oleiagrimonas sp. C23AA TaxID=2719047 RepID=UPI001420F41B|nr:exodeoxyribonuclease VII large subunit [Oleiagrimonas sp. C23AA]NII10536.1 exodeoxyribonuclease VII large subunit [Oleiagrimonas sp. C23AA]
MPAVPPSPPARDVLTPSSLNRRVRDLLEMHLPSVLIEGEISNLARPASGHIYFTLKDANAQVRCAMFRPKSTWLKFRPENGMQVLARARVGLYEPRGEYQLIVDHLEESGEGALRREFDRLKAQLQAEGLFDPANKRALPALPRCIGVITSATGAAIRDVLSVLSRRFPLAEVDVLPVPVQGREAPPAIVAMLERASGAGYHDVLLLTRGGGSLEDLWAFNDESVARAVRASAIPVVCAVGHEVDFSIAEFAADLRAATPSAAAELLVPEQGELGRRLQLAQRGMVTRLERTLHTQGQRLDHLRARLQTLRPQARLAHGRERLSALQQRLVRHQQQDLAARKTRLENDRARLQARHPQATLRQARGTLAQLQHRLSQAIGHDLKRRRETLQYDARALHAVSPLATLERGYAMVLDANGKLVRSAASVAPGASLDIRMADGTLPVKRI